MDRKLARAGPGRGCRTRLADFTKFYIIRSIELKTLNDKVLQICNRSSKKIMRRSDTLFSLNRCAKIRKLKILRNSSKG